MTLKNHYEFSWSDSDTVILELEERPGSFKDTYQNSYRQNCMMEAVYRHIGWPVFITAEVG